MQKILNIQVVKTGKYPLFDTVTPPLKIMAMLTDAGFSQSAHT